MLGEVVEGSADVETLGEMELKGDLDLVLKGGNVLGDIEGEGGNEKRGRSEGSGGYHIIP